MVQRVSGFQIEPRLFGVLDQEPVAGGPADDAPDEAIEQTLEGLRVGRPDAMEPRALRTDAEAFDSLWAVSLYPQLSLYPSPHGRFRQMFLRSADPFFFVRALGPSYISANRLGEREQSNHFAFQAQVGVGLHLALGGERAASVSVSWRHFSNADLFDDNDGIDVPVVLSLGMKF